MKISLSEKLLKAALVGTAQAPPIAGDAEEEIDQLVDSSTELSMESQFLLRAGRLAIYQLAGQIPETVPALSKSPETVHTNYSSTFLKAFECSLDKEHQVLLPEFLSLLAANNLFAPDIVIPKLLDIDDLTIRPMVQAVAGSKGDWLSQFNPDWNWVSSSNTSKKDNLETHIELWNEGTFSDRLAALVSIRRINSTVGRGLLVETITKEKVDNRKQLLTTIAEGLCDEDTEFLKQTLTDRSKYVRQQAANLLGKIPDSEVSQRNRKRAKEIISRGVETKILKLTCHPPQELDATWEEDGLVATPPTKRGQRAFWVEELISKIPLQFWSAHFAAAPVELINGILNDDYAHAVITGWTKALIEFEETIDSQDWLNSLWKYWSALLQHPQQAIVIQAVEQLGLLAQKLPSTDLERLLLQLLKDQHDPSKLPISEVLKWVPGIWSKSFSHEYLRISRTLAASRSDRAVYDWLMSTPQAAVSLTPELFEAALTSWQIRDHGVQSWQVAGVEKLVAAFQARIQMRANFHRELIKITAGIHPASTH